MKKYLLLFLPFLVFSCKPNIPANQQEEIPTITMEEPLVIPETAASPVDTTPVIDTTPPAVEETSEMDVSIAIGDNLVELESADLTTAMREDVRSLTLRRNKDGQITYLSINGREITTSSSSPAAKPFSVNHKYNYTSSTCLKVQAGNTLDGIARDHDLTRSQLISYNPFLKTRNDYSLRTGDIICLVGGCACSR